MHQVILGDSEPGSSAVAGRYRGVATVDHRVERGGSTGTTTPPARPARLHPTRVIRDRQLRLNPGVPAGDASTMEPASNPRRFTVTGNDHPQISTNETDHQAGQHTDRRGRTEALRRDVRPLQPMSSNQLPHSRIDTGQRGCSRLTVGRSPKRGE
jgi:hypothetical protein